MAKSTMLTKADLDQVLESTKFDGLGKRYQGKVRDSYISGDKRILVATDRLSCFDKVITTIPFKGQILTKLAKYWFEKTTDIIPNHVVSIPDPNVIIGREVKIIPIEVVVRGYLAGSALKDYQAGQRKICGIDLPDGLKAYDRLPKAVVTPSTKEAVGEHDQPISREEIIRSGLVSEKLWNQIEEYALKLFNFGSKELEKRGIIFVDTKYEFGLLENELILADEIHTLDSSRFWLAKTYQERVEKGESPQMLDKQPARQWLLDHGFDGNGEIPLIPDDYRIELANHYISAYGLLTGEEFKPVYGDPIERIGSNLKCKG